MDHPLADLPHRRCGLIAWLRASADNVAVRGSWRRRGQGATSKSLQVPGTPLSWCSPRSSNAMPDPATRSFTVDDTSTSDARACCSIRAARCTATPAISRSSRSSISPVWTPTLISSPVPQQRRASHMHIRWLGPVRRRSRRSHHHGCRLRGPESVPIVDGWRGRAHQGGHATSGRPTLRDARLS